MPLEKIVKIRKSESEGWDFTNFFLLFFLSFQQNEGFFLWKILIANHGAIVCGSVFKIEFRVLAREFESIETSPGFARLLDENWV